MEKQHPLILIGDTAFAEIAYEYFTHDSPYEVVAFSVEREYLKKEELFGLPVVPYEDLPAAFAPGEHFFHAATTYTKANQLRKRFYHEGKERGYRPASYVSSHCFVWHKDRLGEHVFIFEDNTVQPFVTIGNNVVLWSGNHIGHHSIIRDHCFISSHVVVSGFCDVGEATFMGVNATVANNVTIGEHCMVYAAAMVGKDLPAFSRLKTDGEIKENKV